MTTFKTCNLDVRRAIKKANVKKWQIAHLIGVSATTFSIMLRFELPKEKKNVIFKAIKQLEEEGAEDER